MIEELAARIWKNPAFQVEYGHLLHEAIGHSAGVKGRPVAPLQRDAVRRLLQSGTHFSASENIVFREAAYRISTCVWKLFGDEYDNIKEIAHLILGRLGNFPAVRFLYSHDGKSRGEHLPKSTWFEIAAKEEANSVWIGPEARITLTDFQRRLWTSLASGKSTAVTAPTSAGKSFALQRYLASSLAGHKGWALYLVPTRALINQVSASLADLFKELRKPDLEVCTIPVAPSEIRVQAGVYVLTQERLQILIESGSAPTFGLTIVDEAQMVAEGARGIILQTVLEKLHARFPSIQLLFGSPQTANPFVYKRIFDLDELDVVSEQESPVSQNLIFLDSDPIRINEVQVSALIHDKREPIGHIILKSSLYDPDQTLAYLSWVFGENEKSLIYAGGQARCEKLASQLIQLITEDAPSEQGLSRDPELTDFSTFLKEHVHPKYLLVESVLHGVGFHYGNMPALVRRTIEEFFDQGRLNFLVCTSTLLHGVNLPAKNLFLLDPTKGRDWDTGEEIPISTLEFWNLAGRAGRLGRDFEGDVFLIDVDRWRSKPLEGEREEKVESAVVRSLVERTVDFISFIRRGEHASGREQWMENTFAKVLNDYRRGKLEATLNKAFGSTQIQLRVKVEEAIISAADAIDVPIEVMERNVCISPFRQQEMLDYLLRRISEDGPIPFIPIHPLRPWGEAHESLLRMFKRIHSHFEKLPKRNLSHTYFAPLALRWMRGEPLARLIDEAYAFKLKRHPRAKIGTTIREVMANVEQDLRFRYVKYSAAYIDLLSEALRRSNQPELVERIPPIPLFLELGACSKTMVSLVGLGLSRTSAGILTDHAVNKDMTRPEVERWLRQQKLEAMSVSGIIIREIRRLLR